MRFKDRVGEPSARVERYKYGRADVLRWGFSNCVLNLAHKFEVTTRLFECLHRGGQHRLKRNLYPRLWLLEQTHVVNAPFELTEYA